MLKTISNFPPTFSLRLIRPLADWGEPRRGNMSHISILQAIVLGVVQGATEFLPVSSSAHLVIFQNLLKVNVAAGQIVAFDVCLHIGTLFAVLLALKKEISVILRGFFVPKENSIELDGGFSETNSRKAIWLVLIGTIPAVIIGFSLKDFFERLFASTLSAGAALIITGFILFATRFVKRSETSLKDMKSKHALAVGLAQAFAIIPGISRSGSTISIGLFVGLKKELSAKFSFLLSIIAIGGAGLLEWKNLRYISQGNFMAIILGTLSAFVVGYICVRWMLVIVRGKKLSWFAFYCWIVGLLTIYFYGGFGFIK